MLVYGVLLLATTAAVYLVAHAVCFAFLLVLLPFLVLVELWAFSPGVAVVVFVALVGGLIYWLGQRPQELAERFVQASVVWDWLRFADIIDWPSNQEEAQMSEEKPPPEDSESPTVNAEVVLPQSETTVPTRRLGILATTQERFRTEADLKLRLKQLELMKTENEAASEGILYQDLRYDALNLPRKHKLRDKEAAVESEELSVRDLEAKERAEELALGREALKAKKDGEAEVARLKAEAEALDAETDRVLSKIKLAQAEAQLKKIEHPPTKPKPESPGEQEIREFQERQGRKRQMDQEFKEAAEQIAKTATATIAKNPNEEPGIKRDEKKALENLEQRLREKHNL